VLDEFRYFLGDGLIDVGLALLIVVVGWLVALLLGKVVARVIRAIGDERISEAMGVKVIDPRRAPSRVAGSIARTLVLLFAVLEAFEVVGFEVGAELITRFLTFGGDVLLGVAILCLGLYVGRLAGDAVASGAGRRLRALSPITQGAVVVLAVFMALDQMGVASDIVRLLFVFTAGAAAVAAALAFGLGCREPARQLFEEWVASLRRGEDGGEDA
jgi:hypothetical protein